uniref:Uncharacterized protein n=1 Tax=Arundo donax TaxID=35708 RepID=A0A0A8YU93_ARUDO
MIKKAYYNPIMIKCGSDRLIRVYNKRREVLEFESIQMHSIGPWPDKG